MEFSGVTVELGMSASLAKKYLAKISRSPDFAIAESSKSNSNVKILQRPFGIPKNIYIEAYQVTNVVYFRRSIINLSLR